LGTRTIVLLLVAVLLPAGSLGVVGLVLVGQQREVLQLREQDRSLLLARVAGDSLKARLDRAARQVVALTPPGSRLRIPGGKDILHLGRLVEGRWEPPYETLTNSPLSETRFQRRMRQLRRSELGGRATDDLLRDYASAQRVFDDSSQATYLRLQQARVLKPVARQEALRILQPLAGADASLVDEFGIPLALYAIEMLGPGAPRFQTDSWLNPTAQAYLLDIDSLASDREHTLLRFASTVSGSLAGWAQAPGSDWLIGRTEDLILGIPISGLTELLADLDGVVTVARREASDQITLAPNFPTLALHSKSNTETASMTPWIIGLALILLLSGLGGFLLLRDYRREKRLAALRAEFVSSVSHEVRTPLAAIRLYTESLLKYGSGDEANWRSDLTTIADETNRLTRMLDNVLRASRIERGSAEYRLTESRVDTVIQRAVKVMTPSLEESGCTVSVVADDVEAMMDRDAIEQALVNLLSNAAKYAPGAEVRVLCERTPTHALVSVEDDGPGIDPAECRRIFESFYRGSTANQTGTGLGLSVVQHIARGHGGEASVSSTVGEGSRFSFQIPRLS
jgi:two-component system, OmpR family, phosphate regulon sensor histidine kinase PhoR